MHFEIYPSLYNIPYWVYNILCGDKKMENKKIPEDIDYDKVNSLRTEAVQKLKQYKPVSIGQASRISGVSPADISVLLVYLGH